MTFSRNSENTQNADCVLDSFHKTGYYAGECIEIRWILIYNKKCRTLPHSRQISFVQ